MKYYLLLPLIAVSALSAGESWYDKEDITLGKSLFDKIVLFAMVLMQLVQLLIGEQK